MIWDIGGHSDPCTQAHTPYGRRPPINDSVATH